MVGWAPGMEVELVIEASSPVSTNRRLPLYYQVEEDMRRRIDGHEWKVGEQIPTETELCRKYRTSRITIRQAVANLVSQGLLSRERGRGTFVRQPKVAAGARGLTSFTEEMRGLGLSAGSRVLSVRREPAAPDVAPKLQVEPGEDLVIVKRLRLGDDAPIGVQTAHLQASRFPGLENASLEGVSLYQYLQERYWLRPKEAEETFEVGPATKETARLLECRAGFCCFLVERVTYDEEGPFEYVNSLMRGDRYRIQLGLRVQD
jgi:GntR family transcriptional regulator